MKKRILTAALSVLLLFSLSITALSTNGFQNISVAYANIKILLNGQELTPTDANGDMVEPFIYNGTTYLPVRAVSEALGLDVGWDASTSTVFLSGDTASAQSSTDTTEIYIMYQYCNISDILDGYVSLVTEALGLYGATSEARTQVDDAMSTCISLAETFDEFNGEYSNTVSAAHQLLYNQFMAATDYFLWAYSFLDNPNDLEIAFGATGYYQKASDCGYSTDAYIDTYFSQLG